MKHVINTIDETEIISGILGIFQEFLNQSWVSKKFQKVVSELRSKGQVGNGKWEREKESQRKCNFFIQKQEDTKQEFPCLLPLQLLCHSYSSVRGGTTDIGGKLNWRNLASLPSSEPRSAFIDDFSDTSQNLLSVSSLGPLVHLAGFIPRI